MERYGMRTIPAELRCVIGFLLFATTLCSCGRGMLRVAYGNYKYAQGEYGQATISYIRALESARDRSVLVYNLGNVYHALGETESAIDALNRAASEGSWDELVFRAHYNLGNIYYELGNYSGAVDSYIASLMASPNDIDAKINLELALKKMSGGGGARSETDLRPEQEGSLGEEYQEVLRLIKHREEETWQSRQKGSSESLPGDW
jgi:tetratricopeptide (TPR) repeat protein